MNAFLRKTYRSARDAAVRWWTRKRMLLQEHPARVAWHFLSFVALQLVSLILSIVCMSLLFLFAPTFTFFRGFSLNLNLQNLSLPRDFLHDLKEKLVLFAHPGELAQRIAILPTDLRQAMSRFTSFLSTHLQDARAFLKERHTFHDWCEKLIFRPLRNHPRIVRESIAFLLAILVAHLLEPLAAPVVSYLLAMSYEGHLPHVGILAFLGVNFTAILAVFLAAILRWVSNGIGTLLSRYVVRKFRHQPPV